MIGAFKQSRDSPGGTCTRSRRSSNSASRIPAGKVELLSADPEKLPDVTMEDQYQAVIEICKHGGAGCVFHTMDEQEVEDILRCPLVSVASDSGIRDFGAGQPHPRGYGTNARVLGPLRPRHEDDHRWKTRCGR